MFVLSKAEHAKITRVMLQIARRALGKKATFIDTSVGGESKWITLSNNNVCRRWRLLPHRKEMIVRRVQFYQQLILYPKSHAQMLMSLFCQFGFEQHAQIDTEGRINTSQAHPWLLQFHDDLVYICLCFHTCPRLIN